MSYATLDDMLTRFAQYELVKNSQRPGAAGNVPNAINEVVVQSALASAAEEMRQALAERYGEPMFAVGQTIPLVLVDCQCWLAWCVLIAPAAHVTDMHLSECRRWRQWLKDVREHKEAVVGLTEMMQASPIYVNQSVSQFAWEGY